jgi:flap endonuclease-1
MGCKGLWAFLESIIEEISLDKIKGKPIIIDIMLYIYKYTIGIRNTGNDIISDNGDNLNHVYAIYNLVKNFSENGILPICVFDGKSPEIKKESVEKRKLLTEIAEKKCKELINDTIEYNELNLNEKNEILYSEYIKNFKRSFSINTQIIMECKNLLDFFGIPYIDAIEEADSQCSVLGHYYKNLISGVLSEDSDVLIFGGPILFRDIDFKKRKIKCLELNKIVDYLQEKSNAICQVNFKKPISFTMDNFIDFTIILGNDYGHGIRSAGGNNREKLFELFVLNDFDMIKYIAHLYQINKLMNSIKYYIPEQFIEKWVLSKNNYKFSEIIEPSQINILMKKPEIEKIYNFFSPKKTHIIQEELIISNLNKLYNYYSKQQLYSIDENTKSNECDDNNWEIVTKGKKFKKLI